MARVIARRSPLRTWATMRACLSLGAPPLLRSRGPAAASVPAVVVHGGRSRRCPQRPDPVRPDDGRCDRRGGPQLQRGGVLGGVGSGHLVQAGRWQERRQARRSTGCSVVVRRHQLGRAGRRQEHPERGTATRPVPGPTRVRRGARRTGAPASARRRRPGSAAALRAPGGTVRTRCPRTRPGPPGPLSSTAIMTPSGSGRTRTQIDAFDGVWRTVFASRFSTMRSTFAASTGRRPG